MKVQRPGILEQIAQDMVLLRRVISAVDKQPSKLSLVGVVLYKGEVVTVMGLGTMCTGFLAVDESLRLVGSRAWVLR